MSSRKSIAPDVLVKHHAVLLSLAQRMVRDRFAAEDVVQDAYVAALEDRSEQRSSAWLSGVVRNKAKKLIRTRVRRRARHQRVARSERLPSTAEIAERTEGQRHLATAIAKLEEPGRSAIVLRYFDGLSPSEIAQRAGVSVRTIESRLRRARKRLAEMLDAVYANRSMRWELALVPMAGAWKDIATGATLASSVTTTASSGAAAWTAGAHVAAAATAAQVIGGSIVGIKSVVAIAAAVGAIGFFAGTEVQKRSADSTDEAQANTHHEDESLTAPQSNEEHGNPTLEGDDEVTQVTRKLSNETALRKEAESKAQALAKEIETLKSRIQAMGGDGEDRGSDVAFAYDKYKGVFARVDWKSAASAYTAMVPMMIKASGNMKLLQDPSFSRKLQELNMNLIHVASSAHKAGVPGKGINGAFTHPAIYVNLVDSALTAAEKPLSEDQRKAVSELGNVYLERIDEFEKNRNKITYALEARIQESTIKQNFFDELDKLLDPEQVEIVHPESIRGLCGLDLMSSGLIWQMHVHPLFGGTREFLTTRVQSAVKQHVGLNDGEMANLEGAIGRFMQRFSDEDLKEHTAESAANLFRVPVVLRGANATLELLKEIVASLPADHSAVAKIKLMEHALVLGLLDNSKK